MNTHVSFSRVEQEILPKYRDNINHAKSTEDVKKFFVYAAQELVGKALEGRVSLEYEDFRLDFELQKPFHVSERLLENQNFLEVWETSDLPHIVARLAETAHNHYLRLDTKHPDRTESKMFPSPGRVDQRHGGH